ncbi:MAG: hypothetical protein AAF594_06285 [Bacteroidota bacterium]
MPVLDTLRRNAALLALLAAGPAVSAQEAQVPDEPAPAPAPRYEPVAPQRPETLAPPAPAAQRLDEAPAPEADETRVPPPPPRYEAVLPSSPTRLGEDPVVQRGAEGRAPAAGRSTDASEARPPVPPRYTPVLPDPAGDVDDER